MGVFMLRGFSATMPQVKFRMQQTRHKGLVHEIRVDDDSESNPSKRANYRGIFAANEELHWCVWLVLGNKNHQAAEASRHDAWYDGALGLADNYLDDLLPRLVQ